MGWETLYRGTHLLANLSWVDFDLGCSIISLPSCSASSANFQAEPGRGQNILNQSQTNQSLPGDGSPFSAIAIHLGIPHLNLLLIGHGAQGSPTRRSSRVGSGRRGVVLAAGRSGGLNVGEPVGLVVGVARLSRAH